MDEELSRKRRLAAILAADIAGYSRLMGENEDATVRDLKGHQAVILPLIGHYGGRIIDTAGDGILAEFPSVIGAAECAVEIQSIMATRNEAVPEHRRMRFRIGINLGDVIHDQTRIYGDGINIAARLEALAEPGGVLVSSTVHEQVRDKLPFTFRRSRRAAGQEHRPAMRVYRVHGPNCGGEVTTRSRAAAARQAVDRGAAVPEHERRPRAGIFRRRHGRGDHHRALAHPLAVRHRPQFDLHLQGASRRREAGRARTRRALCARRLGAQGRQPGAHHRRS